MVKYELAMNEYGAPIPCKYCNCDVPTIDSRSLDAREGSKRVRVCEVCDTTLIGNILAYPEHQGDMADVARLLAQVANLILSKLPKSDG